MSFDIGSFLKNEIVKKTEKLQNATKPITEESVRNNEDQQNEKQIEDEYSKDELTPPADDGEVLEDKIESLQSRPKRIMELIAADSGFSAKIDPLTIGDAEKMKSLSQQCNIYIHKLLSDWDDCSDDYHGELLLDTKKSLFPLLVHLRKGTLAKDLVVSLATVLYHLQQPNENTLAIESYMKLSIGNIAWPIGVTSVGIHARSANAKIQGENGQIANIMLDDRTRLWITSIKRLISFKEWHDKYSKQ